MVSLGPGLGRELGSETFLEVLHNDGGMSMRRDMPRNSRYRSHHLQNGWPVIWIDDGSLIQLSLPFGAGPTATLNEGHNITCYSNMVDNGLPGMHLTANPGLDASTSPFPRQGHKIKSGRVTTTLMNVSPRLATVMFGEGSRNPAIKLLQQDMDAITRVILQFRVQGSNMARELASQTGIEIPR